MSSVRGVVRMFDPTRGYGFIRMEGHPEDIFVHFRDVRTERNGRRDLDPGDVVEFRLKKDNRGFKAFDVVVVVPVATPVDPEALQQA
jgi:cold shock CspA family protein